MLANIMQSKRGKISNERPAGQQRLTGFLQRPETPVHELVVEADNKTSFDTTISPAPSEIFDKTNNASGTSSADTSILESDDDLLASPASKLTIHHPLQKYLLQRQPESSSFSAASLPTELENLLQFPRSRLPPELPFQFLYELHSHAISWNVDLLGLYKEIQIKCRTDKPKPAQRWQAYRELGRGMPPCEVFGPACWDPTRNAIPGKEKHKSIHLKVKLTWAKSKEGALFRPRILAPVIDKSCRFHRTFGGERFLEMQVPFLRGGDIKEDSRHLKNHAHSIFESTTRWLSCHPMRIAGRTWRPFFVDDQPATDSDGVYYSRIHYFAVEGSELVAGTDPSSRPICVPMTIESFIDWHAPLQHNINSMDLKLFARFKLGLSKTVPTVILERTNFVKIADILGSDGKDVMNDGCALMSLELAREITSRLKLDEVPSAFQGRIGGAKGLWLPDRSNTRPIVDSRNFWIEISDSQLKIKPHPAQRDVCEEARTFEVTSWSHLPRPAALNKQLITVLRDRRVSRHSLEDCVLAQSNLYLQELLSAMPDARALRGFLQKHHRTGRSDAELALLASLPDDTAERASQLLDAGFTPITCTYLLELLENLLKNYLSVHLDKMKIFVNESTTVYCAADPCGVLEEGEVHLGFSRLWTNETTAQQWMCLTGMEGLVARNPANLPSDIQKVKFVFQERLSSLTDVVFFSTKGSRPLASLLSGGDYDGDKAWVCWHAPFVRAFINDTDGPPDCYSPKDCGLVQKSRQLSETSSFPYGRPSNGDDFLLNSIAFNLTPSLLGRCTKEHVRLVYQIGLRDSRSKKLAALLSYLVDARKQGYEFPSAAWHALRRECCGPAELPMPAFEVGDESVVKENDPARMNINDFLRFTVARKEIERVRTVFNNKYPRRLPTYDRTLSVTYARYLEWAKEEKARGDDTLDCFLKALRDDIERVYVQWQQHKPKADTGDRSFVTAVEVCYQSYKQIEPRLLGQHQASRRVNEDRDQAYPHWHLLRAACCYYHNSKVSLTWLLAGHELCFLKARASGPFLRVMTNDIYAVTKIDTGAVKRHLAIQDEETEVDDEVGPLPGTIDAYL